ncbi:hypothetical protein [Paenibacillus kandeliae]|uniref:hypothetical protein n=1 Tax=Paenibacillus kandeliae TaxID=3231269 RepID=UPI0034595DF9
MKYRLLALLLALFLYAFVHYNAAHAAGEEQSSPATASMEKAENASTAQDHAVSDDNRSTNDDNVQHERAFLQRTTASLAGTVTDTLKSVTETTTKATSEVTSQASTTVTDTGSHLGNTVDRTADIVGNVTDLTDDLAKETDKLVSGEPANVTGAVSSAVDQTVKDTVDTTASAVSNTTATVTDTVQSTVNTVDHVVSSTTTTTTDTVNKVVDTVNDVVTNVPNIVTEVVKPLPIVPEPVPSIPTPVVTTPPVITPQPHPEHTTNPEAGVDPTSSAPSIDHVSTQPTQTPDDHSASAIHPQSPIQPESVSALSDSPSSDVPIAETDPTNSNDPTGVSRDTHTASEAVRAADEQESEQPIVYPSVMVPIWNWQSWMNDQDMTVDVNNTNQTAVESVDANDTLTGVPIPFAPSGLPLVPDHDATALAVTNATNAGSSSAQFNSAGGNAGNAPAAMLLDATHDRKHQAPIVIYHTRSERGSSQWMNAPPGQPPQRSLYFNGQQSY